MAVIDLRGTPTRADRIRAMTQNLVNKGIAEKLQMRSEQRADARERYRYNRELDTQAKQQIQKLKMEGYQIVPESQISNDPESMKGLIPVQGSGESITYLRKPEQKFWQPDALKGTDNWMYGVEGVNEKVVQIPKGVDPAKLWTKEIGNQGILFAPTDDSGKLAGNIQMMRYDQGPAARQMTPMLQVYQAIKAQNPNIEPLEEWIPKNAQYFNRASSDPLAGLQALLGAGNADVPAHTPEPGTPGAQNSNAPLTERELLAMQANYPTKEDLGEAYRRGEITRAQAIQISEFKVMNGDDTFR